MHLFASGRPRMSLERAWFGVEENRGQPKFLVPTPSLALEFVSHASR